MHEGVKWEARNQVQQPKTLREMENCISEAKVLLQEVEEWLREPHSAPLEKDKAEE